MRNKRFILSLDQSLNTSGWAIFSNNKKLIDFGTFTVPANKPIEQRLNRFIQELNNLIDKYEISEVFFEDIQYQNNIETYKKLAYIQATLMIWCYNNNLKFTILAPSRWRSTLKSAYNGFGFGRARTEQKQKAIDFCKEFLEVEATSDEADAICLGQAGLLEKKERKSAF